MGDDEKRLRRAAALTNEVAAVALTVGQPLAFGRRILDLLLRLHEGEPVPGLPEYFFDWLNDIHLDLRAHEERLFALESDPARQMVVGNYGEQAWREANEQRRKMLGDAVLGVIFSDLSVAELARIERTIRALDPQDLAVLMELDLLIEYEKGRGDGSLDYRGQRANYGPYGAAYHALADGHLGGALLAASGCVSAHANNSDGDHGSARITPLGLLVLHFMGAERPARP